VAGIVGGGLFILLALHPKALVVVALIGITFSRTIEKVSGIDVLTYTDESLTLALVVVLIGGRLLRGKLPRALPGGKSFAIFVVIGLVSSLFAGVGTSLMLQGSFLAAKALLIAWSIAQVDWNPSDLRRGCKIFAGVLVAMIAAGVVNLAIPQAWANLFQNLGYVDYRLGGLPSIISLTTHPLDLGGLMLFAAVAVAAYRSQVKKTAFNFWLLMGTIVTGVLTFRRAILGAMAATLGLEKIREKGIVAVVAGLLVVPIGVTLAWDAIATLANSAYVDYIENGDKAARTILTFDSLSVAAAHFPLGAGFARYGSFLAATNYSPEYVARGYQNIYGMGPVPNGRFLTDTQWPAIIGETGFLGATFFVIGLLLVAKHLWNLRLSTEPMYRWVGITGMGLVGAAAIMSPTSPVFTSSTFIAPVFGLIGIAASIKRPRPGLSETELDVLETYEELAPQLQPGYQWKDRKRHQAKRTTALPAHYEKLAERRRDG
ncbi:MAG TPA: hypothetical protein VJQ54_07520, partial [Candidatus Sulfotelmatobacter sp.]|nr:hypothetical protein [Candidatus Sulfotelmatobacter sp.]